MPLLLQKYINRNARLGVWKIEEEESFFLQNVQLQVAIHHPHKRLQHLAGRYLLSLLAVDFPTEEIKMNEAGKPYLPSGTYEFSISHCGNYAAVIINGETACGIDIELFSPKTELVKSKYLSYDEQACIDSLRSSHPSLFYNYEAYTLCWCAKEAVYKWWGKGKLDFKQNMQLQSISIAQKKIEVDFQCQSEKIQLLLHFLLLGDASLVWLAT